MNVIEWNGSKWAGDWPDPLSVLLDRLENNTLEPSFFADELPFDMAHGSREIREDGVTRYIDTGPLYPEAPYAVIFGGNFCDYSHGFRIVTDDAEVIEVLLAGVQANLASERYQKALKEYRERQELIANRNKAQREGRWAA